MMALRAGAGWLGEASRKFRHGTCFRCRTVYELEIGKPRTSTGMFLDLRNIAEALIDERLVLTSRPVFGDQRSISAKRANQSLKMSSARGNRCGPRRFRPENRLRRMPA